MRRDSWSLASYQIPAAASVKGRASAGSNQEEQPLMGAPCLELHAGVRQPDLLHPGLLRVRRIDTGEEQDISLGANDLKTVSIAPGLAHAVKNTGSGDMVVQVYCSEKNDPANPDTVRHPILKPG